MTVQNLRAGPMDHLYFHLYANAYRGPNTVFATDRENVAFFEDPRAAVPSRENGGGVRFLRASVGGRPVRHRVEGTLLRVDLGAPLAEGDSLLLELEWIVSLPRFRDRIGYRGSNYALAGWYPRLAVLDARGWDTTQRRGIGEFYAEAADYEVTLDVPADFVVAATGERVADSPAPAGRSATVWRARGVRDFAWVADPRYEVLRTTRNGVSVEYVHLPRHADAARAGLERAADALDFFGAAYGRYPYPTFTVAESAAIRPGSGVEYPTLVMISDDLHGNIETSNALDQVVVHEVAHQWWYGLVGNDEGTEAWLDEAFATHATRRYMVARYGADRPSMDWPGVLDFLPSPSPTQTGRFLYLNQARLGFDRPVRMAVWEYDDVRTYIVSTYYKGSWVLDMLDYVVGREVFDRIMRTYACRYRDRVAHTEDFVRVAEEVSGANLEPFFSQWLDGVGTLDYGIRGIVRASGAGGAFRTTVDLERLGAVVMPVEVEATLVDGQRIRRHWDGRAPRHAMVLETADAVASVEVDPDERLADVDRVNNHFPRLWRRSLNPLAMPSDGYGTSYLPWLWYDAGVRVGVLVVAGYPPVVAFPAGLQRDAAVTALVSDGVGGGDFRASISVSSGLDPLGPRAFGDVDLDRRPGLRRARGRLRWFLGDHLYRGPYHGILVSLVHEAWSDDADAALPDHPVEPGTVRAAGLAYTYDGLASDFFPRHGQYLEVGVERGMDALGSAWSFTRLRGDLEVYRSEGRGTLALDLTAGHAAGDAPVQRRMLLPQDAGFLSNRFDSAWADGLAGVTGEVRVEVLSGVLPLSVALAGSAARTWGEHSPAASGLVAEAGVGLRVFGNAPYAFQLDLPVWSRAQGRSRLAPDGVTLRFGRPFRTRGRDP